MIRRMVLGLVIASLQLACSSPLLCAAEPAAPNAASESWHDAYILVPRQPVPIGDKYDAHILRRGDKIQIGEAASVGMLNIRFEADGKEVKSIIPGTLISYEKPKESPAAEIKPATSSGGTPEQPSLQGTWALVGWLVDGRPCTSVELLKHRMMVMHVGDLFQFTDRELTTWSLLGMIERADQSAKIQRLALPIPYEFKRDTKGNVAKIDIQQGKLPMFHPGIYQFDNEFLWLAFRPGMPPFVSVLPGKNNAAQIEERRPKDFSPDELKASVVMVLERVDEREFPAPPRPQQKFGGQGGNKF